MKKLIALVLALAMVAVVGLASAATITINKINGNDHTFEYVQLFTGTQDQSADDQPLGDIQFGSGVTSNLSGFATAVNTALGTNLTASSSAADFADAISAATPAKAKKLASELLKVFTSGTTLTNSTDLANGYYLIIDTTTVGDDDSVNPALLQLTKDITITSKTSITTVDKTVDDVNDSTGTEENGEASADYDVGDTVPFHVTATIGNNVANFKEYHLNFNDQMQAGLSYNSDFVITTNDGTKDITLDADNTKEVYYVVNTFTAAATGNTGFDVTVHFKTDADGFIPAKWANKAVTVNYSATLTSAAVVDSGVQNKVTLKYSNNPNSDDGSDEGEDEKTNLVFTYTVHVDKVTGQDQHALTGAEFELFKLYANDNDIPTGKTAASTITYNNGTETYTIGSGEYWVSLGKQGTDGTASSFAYQGVDDGIYLLVETKTPIGYNSIKPSKFKITASHTGTALVSLAGEDLGTTTANEPITLTQNQTHAAELDSTVLNNQGTTLPSTGGIGTTIFYILGGLLVVGAAVILVARRKAQD